MKKKYLFIVILLLFFLYNFKLKDFLYYKDSINKKNFLIDYLEKKIEVYSLSNFDLLNAKVTYNKDNFIIDKGLLDGVLKDQVVVTDNYLIGKIESVSYKESVVKLVTSDNNYISVSINNSNKLLNRENNNLVIRGINKGDDIKIGDLVLTSGLSNIYPKELLIGEISSIEDDETYTGYIAKVKIYIDINNIKDITVINTYKDK
jgi:rod shape-determining protein MreC